MKEQLEKLEQLKQLYEEAYPAPWDDTTVKNTENTENVYPHDSGVKEKELRDLDRVVATLEQRVANLEGWIYAEVQHYERQSAYPVVLPQGPFVY